MVDIVTIQGFVLFMLFTAVLGYLDELRKGQVKLFIGRMAFGTVFYIAIGSIFEYLLNLLIGGN